MVEELTRPEIWGAINFFGFLFVIALGIFTVAFVIHFVIYKWLKKIYESKQTPGWKALYYGAKSAVYSFIPLALGYIFFIAYLHFINPPGDATFGLEFIVGPPMVVLITVPVFLVAASIALLVFARKAKRGGRWKKSGIKIWQIVVAIMVLSLMVLSLIVYLFVLAILPPPPDAYAKPLQERYEQNKDNDLLAAQIAGNPGTLPETLRQIFEDHYPDPYTTTTFHLLNNPNTPSDVLRQIYEDKTASGLNESYFVRKLIAGNPTTPQDILEQLSTDPSDDVREAAKENLKQMQNHYGRKPTVSMPGKSVAGIQCFGKHQGTTYFAGKVLVYIDGIKFVALFFRSELTFSEIDYVDKYKGVPTIGDLLQFHHNTKHVAFIAAMPTKKKKALVALLKRNGVKVMI